MNNWFEARELNESHIGKTIEVITFWGDDFQPQRRHACKVETVWHSHVQQPKGIQYNSPRETKDVVVVQPLSEEFLWGDMQVRVV